MRERGTYGKPYVGANPYDRESSLGTWIVGGLFIAGAVLWAKHQSNQIAKLYAAAGLPHQSFAAGLRERTQELSSSAGEKIHGLAHRLSTRKET